MQEDNQNFVRTTIYLPRKLHESAKIMSICIRSNLSNLIRISLSEKMKSLKEDFESKSKDNK